MRITEDLVIWPYTIIDSHNIHCCLNHSCICRVKLKQMDLVVSDRRLLLLDVYL